MYTGSLRAESVLAVGMWVASFVFLHPAQRARRQNAGRATGLSVGCSDAGVRHLD